MHANSRSVTSPQSGIHERLHTLVARHALTSFRKPIAEYNQAAFTTAMAAWDAAGRPPLILDAGCGVGLSTLHLATHFPDHFVLGVDQSADRLSRAIRWSGPPPANCVRLRADLVDFWRLLAGAGITLARHYLLYPNPWPKPSGLQRRWHAHPAFPAILALGGILECRSNWGVYVEEFASAVTQLTGEAVTVEPFKTIAPMTPFEEKYLASGHALWRCRSGLMRPDTSAATA